RPLTIIPILMLGSSIAAILTYLFQVEVPAPHGGFIVLPVVNGALLWILAILIGSVVAGYLMSLDQKRSVSKNESGENLDEIETGNSMDSPAYETELISPSQIYLEESLKSKEEVFNFIAQAAVDNNISKDYQSVFEALSDREKQSTTGMEN